MKKAINLKDTMNTFCALEEESRRMNNYAKWIADPATSDSQRAQYRKQFFEKKAIVLDLQNRLAEQINPITTAIEDAEGKARERRISARLILSALQGVDERFAFASKKAKDGLCVVVDWNAQDFPNAYKYTPMSTQFSAEYKNGSWRLTDITREACKGSKWRYIIHMSDTLKEALIKEYSTIPG